MYSMERRRTGVDKLDKGFGGLERRFGSGHGLQQRRIRARTTRCVCGGDPAEHKTSKLVSRVRTGLIVVAVADSVTYHIASSGAGNVERQVHAGVLSLHAVQLVGRQKNVKSLFWYIHRSKRYMST